MFEICNNIIENLIIAIFICSYLKIDFKKRHLLLVTVLLNAFISMKLTEFNIIGLSQTLIIQFVFCFTLYKIRGKFCFQDIIVSFYSNILLFMSVYFSVIILAFIFDTSPMELFVNNNLYLTSVIISKSIFILLCYLSCRNRYIPEFDLRDNKLNIIFIFELLLIMIMAFYFVQTILTTNYSVVSNLIYLCFIFLFITFYMFVKEYISLKNNIHIQEINNQKEKYIRENIKNLKRIKNDIRNAEHRINYILQLIEYDINNQNYEQAKLRIQLNKELMFKIEPALQTGNELFDFMINMEVKEMFIHKKRIKICSFISVNDAYNQFDLWNPIVDVMHQILEYVDFIELYFSETENAYFEAKIFVKCTGTIKNELLLKLKMYSELEVLEMDYMLIVRYRRKLHDND